MPLTHKFNKKTHFQWWKKVSWKVLNKTASRSWKWQLLLLHKAFSRIFPTSITLNYSQASHSISSKQTKFPQQSVSNLKVFISQSKPKSIKWSRTKTNSSKSVSVCISRISFWPVKTLDFKKNSNHNSNAKNKFSAKSSSM